MKLPSASIRDKRGPALSERSESNGFTLIEILVVIALITTIASIGIVAGIDSYQRFLFWSNVDAAISLLQKARSSAIHNMNETSRGVYFCDPAKFVLFRGATYDVTSPSNFPVDKSGAVTVTSCPSPNEIVFAQLSGETVDTNIVLTDGVRSTAIEINHEGGINW